jgi:hypothetical protein
LVFSVSVFFFYARRVRVAILARIVLLGEVLCEFGEKKKITPTVINFREATREKKRFKNETKRILERRNAPRSSRVFQNESSL